MNNRTSAIILISLAITPWLPVRACGAESNSRVMNYKCGQTELRVLKIQEREGQRVQVAFFDSNNKEIYPDVVWPGDFLPLCNMSAFVLLDTSVHHKLGLSFLMNTSPKVVASYEFGEISSFDGSTDGRLFWVQSRSLVDQSPITMLRVYDYLGAEIFNKSYTKGAAEAIMYRGQRYQIRVEEPDFPG